MILLPIKKKGIYKDLKCSTFSSSFFSLLLLLKLMKQNQVAKREGFIIVELGPSDHLLSMDQLISWN